MTDAAAILRRCKLFARLEPPQLERVVAMALPQSFEKNEVIFRQDDPCPGIYVVESGQVRIYKLNPAGKEHVLHLARPGDTFAEVAVIGGFACPANAEALEPTRCVLLPATPFARALRDDHALCLQLMTSLAMWVRQFVGLMEDIVLRDAMGRLSRYLAAAAEDGRETVELPTLKRHLASHLNLTSETLSRTLRRMEELDLIERVDAGRVRVLDADALRDAAEGL